MSMRTRLLYEMFLPEARFPDEKFWNRDGSPIHPKPKSPPPGSRGKTHADLGARDQDDRQSGRVGLKWDSWNDPHGNEEHGPFKNVEEAARFISGTVHGSEFHEVLTALVMHGTWDNPDGSGSMSLFSWDQR